MSTNPPNPAQKVEPIPDVLKNTGNAVTYKVNLFSTKTTSKTSTLKVDPTATLK